jgi:predicted phosphodiesterase
MIKDCGDFTYVNCGSVAIPKENSAHSYVLFDSGKFELMSLE